MAKAYRVSARLMSTSKPRSRAGSLPDAAKNTSGEEGARPVIVVAGPTASGKSALALAIARAFGGVVINADSMQVYRELDMLTARPSAEDLAAAPHRLYGIRPAAHPFSAAMWREAALSEIGAAHASDTVPVVCGGTGLYLSALIDGISVMPDVPAEVRKAAIDLHRRIGGASMRQRLAERDSATAARLADGDTQRLVRAWEVVESSGIPISEWQARPVAPPSGLRFHRILLMPPRDLLYAACDGRFVEMLRRGALEEVERLIAQDLDPALPAMKALGVPSLATHLAGNLSLEAAVEEAQRETRRYAKRQGTWFRHQFVAEQVINSKFSESEQGEIFSKIRLFLLTESV